VKPEDLYRAGFLTRSAIVVLVAALATLLAAPLSRVGLRLLTRLLLLAALLLAALAALLVLLAALVRIRIILVVLIHDGLLGVDAKANASTINSVPIAFAFAHRYQYRRRECRISLEVH
jgi:hypothetical protein